MPPKRAAAVAAADKIEPPAKKGRGRPKKASPAAKAEASKEEVKGTETPEKAESPAKPEAVPVKPAEAESGKAEAEVSAACLAAESCAKKELHVGDACVIETGHIYFFYRPKVQHEEARSPDDVARLYVLLSPGLGKAASDKPRRLIMLPKKHLPEPKKHERLFGFVYKTAFDLKDIHHHLDPKEYDTKTRGHRVEVGARPAGEGVYSIVVHQAKYNSHTHLAYVLELPAEPGDVQEAFNISKEGSYILTVKNPERASNLPIGLRPTQKAKYSEDLLKKLSDYAWVPANPTDFLDYEGAEIGLVAASDDLRKEFGKTGVCLEDLEMKDARLLPPDDKLYIELQMAKKEHPPEPLLLGEFK